MKKLGFAILAVVVMLCLIPVSDSLALYPEGSEVVSISVAFSPECRAFLYMFAHANLTHWAFNSWCLLMLHNIMNTHRCLASYISAVAFGLVWSSLASPSASPVLGFSAVLFWFFGYLIPYYWRHDRLCILMLALYLAVGFLVPNIAGSFHLALLLMGFAYYHVEGCVSRFMMFVTE